MTEENPYDEVDILSNLLDFEHFMEEELLWRAVLYRAFLDARLEDKNQINKPFSDSAWFNIRNKDFLLVCMYANVEPLDVLNLLKEALENPDLFCEELFSYAKYKVFKYN